MPGTRLILQNYYLSLRVLICTLWKMCCTQQVPSNTRVEGGLPLSPSKVPDARASVEKRPATLAHMPFCWTNETLESRMGK